MDISNENSQSLVVIKEAKREIVQFFKNERFFWIGNIKKYKGHFEGFEEFWNEVIEKTPTDILKLLAVAVQQFFESYSFKYVSPLHIAAEKGSLELCDHILTMNSKKTRLLKVSL